MKLYPPLMVLIGLLVQLGIAFGGPVQPLLSAVWQYAGVALMLLSFLTILLLARKFGRTETTILPDGDPSHLMEDGLFAYSRNPIYVAMALLLTGSGLATGQIWGLASCRFSYFGCKSFGLPKKKKIWSANSASCIAITKTACAAGYSTSRAAASHRQ